jgi:hypothetical protein
MARMNGTFDPEIAEMLDFYKTAAEGSNARVAPRAADVARASPTPRAVAYRAIPVRRQQGRGGERR